VPPKPPARPRGPNVTTRNAGAYAVAAAANGRLFAMSLGDGRVLLIDSETPDAEPQSIAAHKGAGLSLCADIAAGAFLSGGDDGKLVRVSPPGASEVIAEVKGRWIDHVAATAVTGFRAYASGRDLTILGKNGASRKVSHATAIGGLAINPKGRRIAASHYNGVSLWWLAQDGTATVLEWKGSHLQLAWSPDGDYVVSTMQENALHGWRLSDGEHMRMSGYAAKIRALAFTRRGHFLATGGADTVICWPFTGGGPMGKAPMEFGGAGGAPATMVAANPKMDVIAAGFDNGAIIVGQPGNLGAMLVTAPTGSSVTAMAWNPDGDKLLAGTESGDIHLADFRI
jgi:WD40 repeat protein